ncbi:AGAP002382-PA-like protein [Anopheles sinensis]|uniref:AGAP002382-PA-like protein n=1 Tax=Anopheles sinensis TaxID=74873 RepID=A0A084W1M7_ANOSI|nr:AGAP002382-PA-like protein [Anopheles sinensis]
MMPPLSWYTLNRTQPGPYRLRLYTSNPTTAYGVTVKSSPLFWHGNQHGTYRNGTSMRECSNRVIQHKHPFRTNNQPAIIPRIHAGTTAPCGANEGHPACVIIRIHAAFGPKGRNDVVERAEGDPQTHTEHEYLFCL